MEIKTFDTILTSICDTFDSLIAPKTIARVNTNVIYLIFKALAKGFEVINNVCVILSNKFNPRYCSEEDLLSVADLVGTEKLKGSGSGLRIIATNTSSEDITLLQGTYTYLFEDISFEFEVLSDTVISAGNYVSYIAMTQEIGSYPVTEQAEISVTSNVTIDEALVFSCADNSGLLGTTEETNLAFRERILTDTTRQNSIVELETEIKNLPYIFDCSIKFNDTSDTQVYAGFTIPPYNALICCAGELKNEIAEKICNKLICPTVQTAESVELKYENSCFVDGYHSVFVTPFAKLQYSIKLILQINPTYTDSTTALAKIRSALFNRFVTEIHTDFIKESDFYDYLASLSLTGVNILGVNILYNNENVEYISIPKTSIPELTEIIIDEV